MNNQKQFHYSILQKGTGSLEVKEFCCQTCLENLKFTSIESSFEPIEHGVCAGECECGAKTILYVVRNQESFYLLAEFLQQFLQLEQAEITSKIN